MVQRDDRQEQGLQPGESDDNGQKGEAPARGDKNCALYILITDRGLN
jgi:hypothetical protein